MKIIVWIMIIAFAFVGLFCVRESIRTTLLRRRRKPFLRRAEGVILRVDKKRAIETSTSNGHTRSRTVVKFFPIIQFRNEQGQPIQFRSEMGESRAVIRRWNGETVEPVSKYATGQTMPICYDIGNQLKPCIDTWGGKHGMNLALAMGGLLFCGASWFLWVLYSARLAGKA